jgi:hypothetical protein
LIRGVPGNAPFIEVVVLEEIFGEVGVIVRNTATASAAMTITVVKIMTFFDELMALVIVCAVDGGARRTEAPWNTCLYALAAQT